MELYNADTGKLLCGVEPVRGEGRKRNQPGEEDEEEEPYDEKGFIAINPCLWSHRATSQNNNNNEQLPLPDFLSLDTTLLSIKRANSTYSHTGEMASWQMRGVLVPTERREDYSSSSSNNNTDRLGTEDPRGDHQARTESVEREQQQEQQPPYEAGRISGENNNGGAGRKHLRT